MIYDNGCAVEIKMPFSSLCSYAVSSGEKIDNENGIKRQKYTKQNTENAGNRAQVFIVIIM